MPILHIERSESGRHGVLNRPIDSSTLTVYCPGVAQDKTSHLRFYSGQVFGNLFLRIQVVVSQYSDNLHYW